MASKTVKLPVVGTVNRGLAVTIGVGGAGVAAYLIYRQRQKAKQAAAASAATAQASNAYGYGAYMSNGYYGYGEFAPYGYGASGGFFPGYYGYGVTQPQGGGNIPNTTNAQWSQAAISQLTSEGYDSQTVSAALGAYITGNNLTAAQVPIVQAAIAIEGYPPVPGAGGFPPGMKTGGGPGGGGGTVAVPNVIGDNRAESKAALAKVGLVYKQANIIRGTAHAINENPPAGTMVNPGSTVVVTMGKG